MKQVQKPKKPLIVYYLIALAALILINWVIFPMMTQGILQKWTTVRSSPW